MFCSARLTGPLEFGALHPRVLALLDVPWDPRCSPRTVPGQAGTTTSSLWREMAAYAGTKHRRLHVSALLRLVSSFVGSLIGRVRVTKTRDTVTIAGYGPSADLFSCRVSAASRPIWLCFRPRLGSVAVSASEIVTSCLHLQPPVAESKQIAPTLRALIAESKQIAPTLRALFAESKQIAPTLRALFAESKQIAPSLRALIAESKQIAPICCALSPPYSLPSAHVRVRVLRAICLRRRTRAA